MEEKIEKTKYFNEKLGELKENIIRLPENQVEIIGILVKIKNYYEARRLISESYAYYAESHKMAYSSPESMIKYIDGGGTIDELRRICSEVIALQKVAKILDKFQELDNIK